MNLFTLKNMIQDASVYANEMCIMCVGCVIIIHVLLFFTPSSMHNKILLIVDLYSTIDDCILYLL